MPRTGERTSAPGRRCEPRCRRGCRHSRWPGTAAARGPRHQCPAGAGQARHRRAAAARRAVCRGDAASRVAAAGRTRGRGALGGGNLDIRHLVSDFAPQPDRVDVSLHRREIEPLVRSDEIDRRVAPDRIHHPEFEQHVAGDWPFAKRRRVAVENFITSHRAFPCLRLKTCPAFACSSALFFRPGRYVIILRRFEQQFKQCDESNLNRDTSISTLANRCAAIPRALRNQKDGANSRSKRGFELPREPAAKLLVTSNPPHLSANSRLFGNPVLSTPEEAQPLSAACSRPSHCPIASEHQISQQIVSCTPGVRRSWDADVKNGCWYPGC